MTSRSIKLLAASTALVAAAGSANAAVVTYSSNSTVPVYTSGTTGLNISGTALISTTGVGPGVLVSGTGAMPINVSSGVIIRSNAVTGTISVDADTGLTGVTINNSGTIINTGNAAAISSTNTAADGSLIDLTIRNTGTISGTINTSGALTYTGTNGIQRGNITSTNTASTEAVTLVGGSMVGNIDLGAGVNNIIVSNSSVTGNFTGGAGVDSITVKDSSTFTGNIATAAGADNVTVSNSRVNGNITTGNGLTTTVLTNATVSGTITDSQAGDADVLTINGQNTFTTMGAISGIENVNFNTSTVLDHGLSGADAVVVAAAKTLTVNNSFSTAAGGTLTNNGTVDIAAGKTVTAASYTGGTGSHVGIGIVSSTSAGKLVLTTTGATAPSLTINIGANSGYIASGTQFVVVDSQGSANTNASLTTSSTGVYRFSTALNNGDISLTIGRVATNAVVAGDDNKAVAAALDTATANNNAALIAVHSAIGQQTTAAGVENIVESLAPSIDGAGAASVGITVDTGNQISNRLASVRSTSGVATGDAMASKHMWVQGFGSTVEQDDKGGNRGYDASSGGVSVGVDTDTLAEGFTTGLAFSYGNASVDSNASSGASTDIDSYVATVYGSRVLDNGIFINGQVAGGYNKYDTSRNVIGVGTAKGDTDGFQGSAKLEGGKDFAAGGFTVTPLASLQYTYLNMDKYTETGAGGASLTVDPEALSTVDAGAGAQVAYAIPLSDGGTLKPSAHAKYIYRMGDTEMGTTSSFTGGGASFATTGVEADRSSVNLGAGLLLTTVAGTDLSLNYDADIRSNLTGHTGQLKARWAF